MDKETNETLRFLSRGCGDGKESANAYDRATAARVIELEGEG